MSLNDGVLDDLPSDTIVDEDLIKSGSSIDKDQQGVLITAKTDKIPEAVTELSEVELSDLTKADVEFKVVTDNVEKIVELEDVEKEFIAKESIDKDGVRYLDQCITGLLGSNLAIEEFTIAPSKINYKSTMKKVRKHIATEQMAAASSFCSFINNTLNDTVKVLEKVRDEYLETNLVNIANIASLAEAVINDVSSSKDLIIPYTQDRKVDFVDISTMDLATLDFSSIQLDSNTKNDLNILKDNIVSVLNNSELKQLIIMVVDKGVIEFPADREVILDSLQKPVNILTLAKFFNSPVLKADLTSYNNNINECLRVVNTIIEEAAKLEEYRDIKNYLVSNSINIQKFIDDSYRCIACIGSINMLALNVKELFIYISKLTK